MLSIALFSSRLHPSSRTHLKLPSPSKFPRLRDDTIEKKKKKAFKVDVNKPYHTSAGALDTLL